jgi:hypothetical protein
MEMISCLVSLAVALSGEMLSPAEALLSNWYSKKSEMSISISIPITIQIRIFAVLARCSFGLTSSILIEV